MISDDDQFNLSCDMNSGERSIVMRGTILNLIIFPLLFNTVHMRDETVKDIQFVYFNGKTVKDFVKYPLNQFYKIPNHRTFRRRNMTVMLVHGYEESSGSVSVNTMVKSFLDSKLGHNIIVLDWGNMADHTYFNNAARNTEKVGRAAANFILESIGKTIPKNKFYIVAHSLGCHISASIGKTAKIHGVTFPRITGLDCAFPGYYPTMIAMRLSTQSADFVDVIHTDSGRYGIPASYGHVDFWPNGGYRLQPGCKEVDIFRSIGAGTIKNELCSHHRSWQLYAESVQHQNNFLAVKCSNLEMFNKNRCYDAKTGYMGYLTSNTMNGDYYLITEGKSPYGKGKHGIKANKDT